MAVPITPELVPFSVTEMVLEPLAGLGRYQRLVELLSPLLSSSRTLVMDAPLYVTLLTVRSASVESSIATPTTNSRLVPEVVCDQLKDLTLNLLPLVLEALKAIV